MEQVSFGPFRLDRTERRLHRGAAVIPLRPKTFAVLDHLVARPRRLATKAQLLAAVWPDTAVSDVVLKVCVREIREALGDDPEHPRYVETAHRLGYRFIGRVSLTNLPAASSSLVGRRHEIEEIAAALRESRLLTLVGAGGVGKSRLALEAARQIQEAFEDGVWWVDLATLNEPAFVPNAVAAALGLRDSPGEPPLAALERYVSTREILLVVDNCEHLLAATAGMLHGILSAGTSVRALATSREPLKIDAERPYAVPPLAVPALAAATSASDALAYDAVNLFDERARAVLPGFALSDRNCQAVVDVCRHVDGLPLAIELAAARVPVVPVEEIGTRLHASLHVLGSGRRSGLPRHQTLRAAIDWSYDLLDAGEQRLLARLSLFAGSFTLDAAECVGGRDAAPKGETFDLLSRLLDKSLVFVADRSESYAWRYRLLETVRQYAGEKLQSSDHAADACTRYVQYYLDVAERAELTINTIDRPAQLAALEREHGNLRHAIERAAAAGDTAGAARLAAALFWFWFHRGHWRQGRAFLGAAIDGETAPSRVRARALLGDGVLAWAEGAYTVAVDRLEECVAIGRTAPQASTTAHALHFLAMVRLAQGDAAAGLPLAEEAVRVARTTQDPFCFMLALASYGVVLLALNRYDEASAALQESVDCGRRAVDPWATALPLRNLAIIASRRGQHPVARRLLEESLRGLRDLREKWFLSRSVETLAEVLAAAGEHERSAHLFGAAEGLREAVGASVLAFYRADYDGAIATVRRALGGRRFDRYRRVGRALSAEEMVDYAVGQSALTRRAARPD